MKPSLRKIRRQRKEIRNAMIMARMFNHLFDYVREFNEKNTRAIS